MENLVFLGFSIILFIVFIVMIYMMLRFHRASEEEKARSRELQKVIDKFSRQVTSRRTIKSMDTHLKQLSKAHQEFAEELPKEYGKWIVKAAAQAVGQQKGVLGEIIVSKALELEFGHLYRLGGDFPADAMGVKDELVQFIEIKTERDKLTPNEAKFKKLIDEGKVVYRVVRLGDAIPQPLKELKGKLFIEDSLSLMPTPKLKVSRLLKVPPCKFCGMEFEQSGQGFRQRMEHYSHRKANNGQCPG